MDMGTYYWRKKRKIKAQTITFLWRICVWFSLLTTVTDARSPFYISKITTNITGRAFFSLSSNNNSNNDDEHSNRIYSTNDNLWESERGTEHHQHQFLLNELDNEVGSTSNFLLMMNTSLSSLDATNTSVINILTTTEGNNATTLEANVITDSDFLLRVINDEINGTTIGSTSFPVVSSKMPPTSSNGEMKKSLTNKSNRSRVNNVFELSSKMLFNSTINKHYRNARAGKVTLLGLFELSTKLGVRPEGQSELASAQMAVMHINRQNLLPGYVLELITNDTKVSFAC